MLPSFPDFTTQIELNGNDIDLDNLKSSVLSNKLVMLKWIQTTEKQLKDEIKKTKNKILTESKKEINYVDEILKEKLTITGTERCSFKDANQLNCKRPNLPYSNHCSEHITQNEDQQLFKRCSIKLINEQQCPNSSLSNYDEEMCSKHLKLIKNVDNDGNKTINKQDKVKSKRRYAKNNSTNENKPRKSRKKKDSIDLGTNDVDNSFNCSVNLIANNNQQVLDNNLIDNITTDSIKNFTNTTNPQTTFTPFTNSTICYSAPTDNSASQFGATYSTDHGLIDYATCITKNSNNENVSNNLNNNLNQLSNLNHSEEDSLVAIVNNNDDLSSVPFEESELSEMLGKIGKIPEDAFNDLFMDNLSTESNELRAIDNIVFNNADNLDNLEPSISNQTFSSSLNFKNSSSYFNDQQNGLQLNNSLMYSNGQQNIDLNNLNGTNNEIICLQPNNLISTDRQIKTMNNHFTNICTIPSGTNQHVQQNSTFNSYNVIDYKPQATIQSTYSSPVIHHQNYPVTASPVVTNSFNTNYLHNIPNNYSSSTLNGQSHLLNSQPTILNGHSNHLMNSPTNLLNDTTNYNNNLSSSDLTNAESNSLCTSTNYLDCTSAIKNEPDKKFNLFTNCKNNTNYPTTYSNIYDDLPSFESNRINGTSSGSSLPSFSIMIKKNRIESR